MEEEKQKSKKQNDSSEHESTESTAEVQDEKVPEKSIEELSAEEVKVAAYQSQYSFAERYADSAECKRNHGDCVPLIIERASKFDKINALENCKFLFRPQSHVAQAMIRAEKDIQAKKMWFFVHTQENKLKSIYPQQPLGLLHSRYRRSDGNLYILYSDQDLVSGSTQTFLRVMQVLTVLLLIVYAYLYYFGVEDVLQFFGYVVVLKDPAAFNSTAAADSTEQEQAAAQSKIEL